MSTSLSQLSQKDLAHNWITHQKQLIREYELVKAKKHPRYRFVQDFYKAHGIKRQNFCKYYNRFKATGIDASLLPEKRGPKWKERIAHPIVERRVIEARMRGLGRYEIANILTPCLGKYAPNPSKVYAILKRNGVNRLTQTMKTEKRAYVKEKAGEMGHIDCHYLPKELVAGEKRLYLVGLIDDATRLVWVEVVRDLTALSVMFATMRSFSFFKEVHQITFASLLSDNGKEFCGIVGTHPFERLLTEMNITHRRTRPMRPQTNGKIERFWRTIDADLIEGTTFSSIEELDTELKQYLWYYNNERPHSAHGHISPVAKLEKCQRIIQP